MTKEEKIYNNLVNTITALKEEEIEIKIGLVAFVINNLIYSPELLKNPKIKERIDTLVTTSDAINRTLNVIMSLINTDYERNITSNFGQAYQDTLKIQNVFFDYDDYFCLLLLYQDCLQDKESNIVFAKLFCSEYNDYLKYINDHFSLINEERINESMALDEKMRIDKETLQLSKIEKKYLKKLEK